jgi:peptidoglycan L-alanyl-D-glutamate endopeptidase CwlK
MINSREISELHPFVAEKCRAFIGACNTAGIDIVITSTYRDLESQAALYAQGRTAPGKNVTNAKPGRSYHNYRVAFDFAPIVNGKIPWNDAALFSRCGEIAEKCGLEWAGRWKAMRELAHCQYTGGLTLEDLRQGKRLPI